MNSNNKPINPPEDVLEIARTLAQLPKQQRQHVAKIVQLAASLEEGPPILERLMATRPSGRRYGDYEKALRHAQRRWRAGQK